MHLSIATAAGIVADGATATTIATAGSGRQTVNIAPTVSGVSHNTYTSFNVGGAGAELNNVGINARNIVNQVTGTNPSSIQGDITVLGPRANVILANPNGITVNGGSFVNTGNVAITTGLVSFNDIVIAPGNTQRNIVLATSQGQITIGPGGLSGAMLDLELIAKSISVNGAVLNTVGNSAATVRAVAGAGHSEIDGSVSPTDLISTWIGHTSPGTGNPGATALDITPLGSLTAGRIELIVTEQGAGVLHGGAIYANVGDFSIAGNGDLNIDGGRIEAAGNVVVANPTLTSQSANGSAPAIKAGGSVDIRAGTVNLADMSMSAGQKTVDSHGNTIVNAVGNILMGTDGVAGTNGYQVGNSTLDATGGIGLYDDTQSIQVTASQVNAQQDFILKSRSAAVISSWAQSGATQSSLVSKTGAVTIATTDALQLSGAFLNGAAGLSLSAGEIDATSVRNAADGSYYKSSLQSGAAGIALNAAGAVNLTGTDVIAATNVLSQSNGFNARNDDQLNTSVVATAGGVVIGSTGDINNIGSLMQGSARIAGNAASRGAITLTATGGILNESPSQSMLSAIFGVNDDVVLQASAGIANHQARIISNTSLSLSAGGDIRNFIDKQAGANGEQPLSYQASGGRWLFLSKRSNGFDVDYGHVVMPGQLAYLVAETGMTVQAANFTNTGGIALVNNGSITVNVANAFHNEALFDGQAHYRRDCMIVCNATASSNVASYGGTITASANIAIQAGTEAANIGGSVLALGDLTVTAPRVYAQGVLGYRAYTQAGLQAWFGSNWAKLYATDTGGSWLAGGKLALTGTGLIEGGSFTGLIQLVAGGGIQTIRQPRRDSVSIERNLGFGGAL